MKKTTLALAVALASLTSVANAAQPDNSWYLGGKVGWSDFHGVNFPDGRTNDVDVSTDGVGGGVFLGYQANPYLAFEAGYDWLGNVDYGNTIGKLTVQGVSVTGKLSYPLAMNYFGNGVDLYARAGAFIHHTKWKVDTGSNNDVNVSPVVAAGFDWRVNDAFTTRLEYQWVNNIGNKSPARPDNGLVSLGVIYNLGGAKKVVPAANTQYRESRFVLNEDVLFNYNRADLKPQAHAELDNLMSTLSKIDPTDGHVEVIGHTDRIGSQSYNLRLSEARANSVRQYFVNKGIPPQVISARGVGKTQPVTGDKCNGLSGQSLRDCLAPDRRVEIEVKGQNVQEVHVIR